MYAYPSKHHHNFCQLYLSLKWISQQNMFLHQTELQPTPKICRSSFDNWPSCFTLLSLFSSSYDVCSSKLILCFISASNTTQSLCKYVVSKILLNITIFYQSEQLNYTCNAFMDLITKIMINKIKFTKTNQEAKILKNHGSGVIINKYYTNK